MLNRIKRFLDRSFLVTAESAIFSVFIILSGFIVFILALGVTIVAR